MKITREEKRDMMITLNTYGQGRAHDVAFENKLEQANSKAIGE